MATKAFQKIYTKITQITKATCSLKATGVGYDELGTVNGKLAQVVKIAGDEVTLQVFEGTEGIPTNAEVVFLGKSPTIKVSEQLAGRFFNAIGDPIDGGPEIEGQEVEIGGPSVNPVRRKQPSELIATGIAGIDLNNTLVSGQKIPFFADPDQPFNQVMANVALRAETDKIILGGMGMTNDDYLYFKNVFSNAGALDRIVSFMNTTENPPVERLLIPDMALTAAEYFAVEHNEKVLVLLTDMTNYADALAIVSNRMDQIPSKDSMPGSLYSDLAKIYEKAVQFPAGGSITIIAVTTLSGGDITHAVPDNTGYITEGQLYLRKDVAWTDAGHQRLEKKIAEDSVDEERRCQHTSDPPRFAEHQQHRCQRHPENTGVSQTGNKTHASIQHGAVQGLQELQESEFGVHKAPSFSFRYVQDTRSL